MKIRRIGLRLGAACLWLQVAAGQTAEPNGDAAPAAGEESGEDFVFPERPKSKAELAGERAQDLENRIVAQRRATPEDRQRILGELSQLAESRTGEVRKIKDAIWRFENEIAQTSLRIDRLKTEKADLERSVAAERQRRDNIDMMADYGRSGAAVPGSQYQREWAEQGGDAADAYTVDKWRATTDAAGNPLTPIGGKVEKREYTYGPPNEEYERITREMAELDRTIQRLELEKGWAEQNMDRARRNLRDVQTKYRPIEDRLLKLLDPVDAPMETIRHPPAAVGEQDRLAPEPQQEAGGVDLDAYEAAMQRMVEAAREKEAREAALRGAEEALPEGSEGAVPSRTDPVLGGFLQDHAAAGQAESAAAGRAADAAQTGYETATRAVELQAQDRLAAQEQALADALRRERATAENVLAEQDAARRDGFTARFQDLLLQLGGAVGMGLGGGAGEAAGSAIMEKQVDHLERDQAKEKEEENADETIEPPPPPVDPTDSDSDHDHDKPKPKPKPQPDSHAQGPHQPHKPKPPAGGTQPAATPKPSPTAAPPQPAAAPAPTFSPPQPTPKPPIDMVLGTGGEIRQPYAGEVTHRDPDTGYLLPGP